MSRQHILETYWVEFLGWVKEFNIWAKASTDDRYEKDATDINFWHWYIENKLDKEQN